MPPRHLLPLLAGLVFAGCQKSDPDAVMPPPSPEAAAAIETQFVPSTNQAADTIQERLNGTVHPELTMRLHLFIEKYGRFPENFYEFSNTSMDSVPPLPPGMKFEIDEVDKSVKAVKK